VPPPGPQTFRLRTGRLTWLLVRPLAWGSLVAEIGEDALQVRMGLLGSANVPLASIDRIGRMNWPWWGGIGARLGRKMVAFAPAIGEAVMIELSEPISVRAPLSWKTPRVVVIVEETEAFIDALATARRDVEVRALGAEQAESGL
jgi:hypothetical protein